MAENSLGTHPIETCTAHIMLPRMLRVPGDQQPQTRTQQCQPTSDTQINIGLHGRHEPAGEPTAEGWEGRADSCGGKGIGVCPDACS